METKEHSIITLHDLLMYELKKIADAEIQLGRVLPQWTNKVTSLKLKDTLKKYSEKINQQIEKLELFFLNEKILPITDLNEVMKAFIKETEGKQSGCSNVDVLDACILASIQEINHYKISVYGTASAFASLLKMNKAMQIFREAEVAEKHIDDRLSQLAEFEINQKANMPLTLE